MAINRELSNDVSFLAAGGEMGERMRAFDWSATSLGPAHLWPASLQTAVRIMLTSRQPMFVWWGPELINLYNDAYISVVRGKHPEALGMPASQVWGEIWDEVEPRALRALLENDGTYDEALLLIMERNGYPEETYYTFSYSPIMGESGRTEGIFCANTEDTQRIQHERQVAVLRDLAAATSEARSAEEACTLSAESLAKATHDIPFALIYLAGPGDQTARLQAAAGLAKGHGAAPVFLQIAEGSGAAWPIGPCLAQRSICLEENIDEKWPDLPTGNWSRPPHTAAIVPLPLMGISGETGVLIVGLNPHRAFDPFYREFLEMVASHISTAIGNATAYQQEKQRAEALAEIDRAKTTFFSNVSHEFRTPLSLMLGPLEEMLEAPDNLPAEARDQLAVVYRNGERLQRLVNALLDFARLEAGRIRANFQPTDLATLTRDLCSLFRSAMDKAGLQLRIDCPPLPGPVHVDREMWEQILLNLLSNAFKYTLKGHVAVSLFPLGDYVRLEVRDTGTGIPDEELPRIFERFHRVEGSTGRTHEGTGIGLAFTSELVRLHSGEIRVRSVMGEGSTFIVEIPYLPPATQAPASHNGAASPAMVLLPPQKLAHWLPGFVDEMPSSFETNFMHAPGERATAGVNPGGNNAAEFALRVQRPTILVADDNHDMRAYLSRILAPHYNVVAASNGQDALAQVKVHGADLVLTDVMMPVMDGFELLSQLRHDPETETIPVIIISARAGEEARIEGLQSGADEYLTKPFSAKELLARVSGTLQLARVRMDARKMEKELRADRLEAEEARQRFAFLVENSTDFIAIWGLDYSPIYLNRSAIQLLGAGNPDKALEVGYLDLFSAPDQAWVKQSFLPRVMAKGQAQTEIQFQPAGASGGVWMDHSLLLLKNSGGEIQWFATVSRDITDRKKSEGDKRLLAAIVESSEDAIISKDLNGIITSWNSGATRLFGYTPDEIVGRHITTIIPSEREAEETNIIARIRRGVRVEHFETVRVAKDGSLREVSLAISPLRDDRNTIIGASKVARDISERRRAERLLLEADRRKDEFLATLAHELRNPLAPLRNGLSLLKELGESAEVRTETLQMMERQLGGMTRLIDDLMDLSRITRGKVELRLERVNLADAIRAAVETSRPLMESAGHTFREDLPEEPIYLQADITRLAQIFSNLLNNAAKYTPHGGEIEISARRTGAQVKVCVTDNGQGLTPQVIPHIFEMFTQVDSSLEKAHGGLGIGLHLVQNLVQMHGGTVGATSPGPGQGSTFVVELPCETAVPVQEKEPTEVRQTTGGRKRVLVADDNADISLSMALLLKIKGHEVRTASDGTEAVQVAEDFQPDVILMDIGMPGLNGYDACRKIREQPWATNTVICALTGWGQEDDKRRSREAGFDHHLVKPVEPATLLQLINGR